MSTAGDSGKQYYNQCTGLALETVKAHSEPQDLTLFAGCFYEVDPYKKPQDLLEVSPKGLVPGLRLEKYSPPRGLNESTVILEYLEDLAAKTTGKTLLPKDPYSRALVRLQADHVGRSVVPAFYRYLQAQDPEAQITHGKDFHATLDGLEKLLERAEREIVSVGGVAGEGERKALASGLGLWIEGGDLGLTDVMVGPWLYRATIVLKHYRGFDMGVRSPKFKAWLERLFTHPDFNKTCSTDELYLDSYERYAYNRPNTSQVADAINAGRALP
ncbi:hypothetical protein AX16_008576 [Volvariella volvacea WC 439]|nr:hypothetical protein AX16_008576 [Volvariella volvacea WC 439]